MSAATLPLVNFAKLYGFSFTKAKELVRQGFIPVLKRENDKCMLIVNRKLYDELAYANKLTVPKSERSVLASKKKEQENEI